jgi:hypothetical protein
MIWSLAKVEVVSDGASPGHINCSVGTIPFTGNPKCAGDIST